MREEITSSVLSRPGGRLGRVLVLAGLAATAPACGDGPICASDIAVFITTPDNGGSFVDGDDIPGIQSTVIVRTNLHATETVMLRMVDQFGFEQRFQTVVDDSGTATFALLTIPEGPVTLEATGITEQCGSGQDLIQIDVTGISGCELQLGLAPEPNSYYAPLPVFNRDHDSNLLVDGFQADAWVLARPGYFAELLLTDLVTGTVTSAGMRTIDSSGVASYTFSTPEGPLALDARCVADDGSREVMSNRISAFVDTRPPACTLLLPSVGQQLSPADDIDGDPTNGTQIDMLALIEDEDPDGLAPLLPLFAINVVSFEGSEPDEQGMSSVTVTLTGENVFYMGVTAQDRAGNSCSIGYLFEYLTEGLQAQAVNRQAVRLSWVAPEIDVFGAPAASYELRIGRDPIDEFNFDDTGELVVDVPVPGEPGTPESMLVEGLKPGADYYAALVAVGSFGDRKFLGAVGPVKPDFDRTDTIGPVAPDAGNNSLGYQVAAGNFNGDAFGDIAVSAPFKTNFGGLSGGAVYVYFGGPDGVSATPDKIFEGDWDNGQLGSGLTAIRWNDDDIDDLAVGEPGGDYLNGRVLVFLGGPSFVDLPGPDVIISGSYEDGDWFLSAGLGFALTRARFDGDARDDLVITAPGGGNGNGGVVVVYGGATSSNIVLASEAAAGSGDAVALVLEDPDPGSIFVDPPAPFFGHYVFPLGRTQGASDTDDDIGVAYTEKNAVVVFRGRARPSTPGVTLADFDPARDLEIQRTTATDPSARFGSSMGSIADINGDGARDIVVGMWRDGNNVGRVEIYRGNAVGVRSASTIRLRSIAPSLGLCTSNCGVGSAVLNNAGGLIKPDINGDGLEDLSIVTGMGVGQLVMLVWFGGNIPTNPDITTDTADYLAVAPVEFIANAVGDSDATSVALLWAGDVNGDGLEDICWADASASSRDGAFTLLYDDGQ